MSKRANRTALFPGLDVLARAISVVAHAFGVGPGAIGAAFQERGPLPATGAIDGERGRVGHGRNIVAIDLDAGHAVGVAPTGHAGIGRRVGKRYLGGELIILADED